LPDDDDVRLPQRRQGALDALVELQVILPHPVESVERPVDRHLQALPVQLSKVRHYGRQFERREWVLGVTVGLVHRLELVQQLFPLDPEVLDQNVHEGSERPGEKGHPVVERVVQVCDK
jgi:hypothetical protein